MISLLAKLPLIGSALNFVKNKGRLVIEYILIAMVVATASLALTLWVSKSRFETKLANTETQLEKMTSRVTTVERVNEQQEKTIGTLQDLRKQDAEALGGLLSDFKDLAARDIEVRRKLTILEKTNETVRTYLNQPIPPDLVCVLNDSCTPGDQARDAGGKGGSSGSAGAAVHRSR